MSKLPQILIANDQALQLNKLREFAKSLNFSDVIETTDGDIAYQLLTSFKPTIGILDINLSGMSGLEIAEKIHLENKQVKLIIITSYQERKFFTKLNDLGVLGYIFRACIDVEFEACLQSVLKGESYISSELKKFYQLNEAVNNKMKLLTPSERKILTYIAMNHTTPEIALRLFVSKKTVEKHRSNISKKLDLSGKTNSLLLWVKENIKPQEN